MCQKGREKKVVQKLKYKRATTQPNETDSQ